MLKEVVYEDQDFRFVIEYADNTAFLHCAVYNYGVGVYKKMLYHYSTTRDRLIDSGYDIMIVTQRPKFVKFLDKTMVNIAQLDDNGEIYEVFKWKVQHT